MIDYVEHFTINSKINTIYYWHVTDKVVRLPVHHSDDGAVYTCQMTLADMVQQCNVTLNVTCMYFYIICSVASSVSVRWWCKRPEGNIAQLKGIIFH